MAVDYEQLKAAGFKQAEIDEYKGLIDAGFSEQEVNQHYAKSDSSKDSSFTGMARTAAADIWDKVKPYVRPALEMGGAMGGFALGGGPLNPPGAFAGAGLGLVAGKTAADFISNQAGDTNIDPLSLPYAAEQGKAFVSGVGMEAGGAILGKGVSAIGSKLAQSKGALSPEAFYGRSIKTPAGKWDTLYKDKDLTARQTIRKAGLESEIPPTEFGLAKAQAQVNGLTKQVENKVQELTTKGIEKARIVNGVRQVVQYEAKTPSWVIRDALTGVERRAVMSGPEAQKVVEGVKTQVDALAGVKSKFTPDQLYGLKQQMQKEVEWEAKNPIINIKNQFTQDAKKAIENAAMKELERMSPEIKYLSEKSAARLDLMKAISHTINREASKDAVGFGSKILAIKNIGYAILDTVLRLPSIQARIAFAIKKGADMQAKTTSRALSYGIGNTIKGNWDSSSMVQPEQAEEAQP